MEGYDVFISKKLIQRVFQFLEDDYKYVLKFEAQPSAIFLDAFTAEYENKSLNRNFTIYYGKTDSEGTITYSFSPSISKVPYMDIKDFLSVNIYLEFLGKDSNMSLYQEFQEGAVEGILESTSAAIRSHLLPVIEGSVWLDDFYPRKD